MCKCTGPGSNWRHSACEADVIATRPQVHMNCVRERSHILEASVRTKGRPPKLPPPSPLPARDASLTLDACRGALPQAPTAFQYVALSPNKFEATHTSLLEAFWGFWRASQAVLRPSRALSGLGGGLTGASEDGWAERGRFPKAGWRRGTRRWKGAAARQLRASAPCPPSQTKPPWPP